ncbi:MAG: hypothetical protein RQ801_00910 [Spirochaetaceae bacterium]|nr:hypothetical protein [Spirochaetaceae bacterium]MDT8296830.1 hypothetical protein [Spirochaetaceae bacterium]
MGNRTQSGDSNTLCRTDIFVTMILALVFLLYFTYVLADHFTSPPSPGISRELLIGEVEMAPYGVFRDRIASFAGSEAGTLTVAAVDGTSMRFFPRMTWDSYARMMNLTSTYPPIRGLPATRATTALSACSRAVGTSGASSLTLLVTV